MRKSRLLALALGVLAPFAHADYKDDYAHGVKAYRDGQYAEARSLLQQALDEHAEPAVKIRLYGQVYEPYLPQHYLGMAALKLGDCSTAAAQWNSAPNKQIVAQMSDIGAEEQRGLASCGGKIAKAEEKPAPPVETPKPVPAEPPVKTTVAENKPPVAPPVKPVPPPPKPSPPAEEKPARSGPPEPLVQAFDNYLAGRYAEVARVNPESYADNRARFHAYLVRAASKYTLSRIAADEAMLRSAQADAAAARALDARTAPDATLFSPDFRTFFQEAH